MYQEFRLEVGRINFYPLLLPDHDREQDDDRDGLQPARVLAGEVMTGAWDGHEFQLYRLLPMRCG